MLTLELAQEQGGGNLSDQGLILPINPWGTVVFIAGMGAGLCQGPVLVEALAEGGLAVLVLACPESDLELDLALDWVQDRPELLGLPLGLAGMGEGAAVALSAGLRLKGRLKALVACQGGAELAELACEELGLPTLFVVDGGDKLDIEFHQAVVASLRCKASLAIATDAQEPGHQALNWFQLNFIS